MKSILEELYLGNIHPMEYSEHLSDSDTKQLTDEVLSANKVFCGKLSKELNQEFERIMDLYGERHYRESLDSFVNGYRLGTLSMIEVFTKAETE